MKEKILVIDDDPATLDVVKELLDYEGYEAIAYPDTDDVISLASEKQPALILLDLSFNGINGGNWCMQLKSDKRLVNIPVIIYTAYANKGLKTGSYGCNGFIAKPFDIADLISCIHSLTRPALPGVRTGILS